MSKKPEKPRNSDEVKLKLYLAVLMRNLKAFQILHLYGVSLINKRIPKVIQWTLERQL